MARISMPWTRLLASSLAFLSVLPSLIHANMATVTGTDAQGVTRLLEDSRHPALYTGAFGDCMGGQSLLNVTAFDAAYYADNMTVLFHLMGTTNLKNETVMVHINVDAYGSDRFDLNFDPCNSNINSLCPMNRSVPIVVEAIIPVSSSDVSGIPNIALSIPDFEGTATIRIFSNATQTQIGCFRAIMRNGASMNQADTVAPVLGLFTIVAIVSSFATAIYGINVPAIRTHYAHSLSVLVVFEVFHSIFFSGALSLNWPSVLAGWWANFAWSAGMIYTPQMTNSINNFVGNSGNSSQVGGAGSTPLNNNGGLQQQIYGRSLDMMSRDVYKSVLRGQRLAERIIKRATGNNSTAGAGYSWSGGPVLSGIPVPGNWSGFAGELSEVNIAASDAFMTGFLWFLILVAFLIGVVVAFKWLLEGLSSKGWIKQDRLELFRNHWVAFLGQVVLRTVFIGFFMMMTLAVFQFSFHGNVGVTIIAVIVFVIFFVGTLSIAGYACFYRLRFGHYESSPDQIYFKSRKVLKVIPWYRTVRRSTLDQDNAAPKSGGLPFFRIRYIDDNHERTTVHQDEDYITKFGWLSARYRRTRWWFFAVWIVYQFVRACFIGGAGANPETQVFGLLLVEIIASIGILWVNPFEGSRNTALAVYMLSISKVATVGLSVAFLPRFNLDRIIATVIGVIIIVIQGFLTVGLVILIVLSAISTWFSLSRNREEFPQKWDGFRVRYFNHIEMKATDLPPPPPPIPEEPKEPYFNVTAVRRAPKIEDEDADLVPDLDNPAASQFSLQGRTSRANSIRSHHSGFGNAPYGARHHRLSWSSREFANWQQQEGIDGSPSSRGPSRHTSGHYPSLTADTQISMAPLVRPQTSLGSLRPGTPTKEQQNHFAGQRFGKAKMRNTPSPQI